MRISDWSSDVCSSDLLPDEEPVRLGRRAIARNPSGDVPVTLRDDAGVGKVGALQQVAVCRVPVERRTGRNQFRYGCPLLTLRHTKTKIIRTDAFFMRGIHP